MGKQLILDKNTTLQKIRRIAYEIHENNYQESEIIVAGTMDNGYVLAEMIVNELKLIAHFKIELIKVFLDKLSPTQSKIELSIDTSLLKGKTVILIDDVLNSGRTLAYALKPFLNIEIKKIQTAVLVDRDNKNFPISANYNGFSLSTTLQEHVTVVLSGDEFGVYLS
jgi:pyrimidine operon attenuation protein / uracil phosphoribosyltransferase